MPNSISVVLTFLSPLRQTVSFPRPCQLGPLDMPELVALFESNRMNIQTWLSLYLSWTNTVNRVKFSLELTSN